ncbi:MAG TPA: dTMP kinase [Chloroflexota bacterium]|nr:dTMP kinase [Chloroflexota bacterium]
MLITLEGPEGSGKSVQSRLLIERLRQRGRPTLHTHEPGGTPLGDHLRQLLLLRDDLTVEPRAEALMMNASRAQLVEQVIRPALERGEVVVCDRFADSTLAYQGAGRGLDEVELRSVISFATAGVKPDMSILLDVPVEVGLARKHAGDGWNRFEAETLAFHERVRAAYLRLAGEESDRWQCFSGERPVDALAEDIWRAVASRLDLELE